MPDGDWNIGNEGPDPSDTYSVYLNDKEVEVNDHDELRNEIINYATEMKFTNFVVVSNGMEVAPEALGRLNLPDLHLKIAGYFKAS